MDTPAKFARAVYSLGSGCPHYRHSMEPAVPWPHLDNPLRLSPPEDVVSSWEKVIGKEELKKEIARLGRLDIPEEEFNGPVLSHHVDKPSRVIYSTHIPLKKMNLVSEGTKHVWRVCSPDYPGLEQDSPFPGYALLRELRVRGEGIRRVELKIGPRLRPVQTFDDPIHIITFLQRYLGLEMITGDLLTLPFFFSRDPAYALPLFVVGRVELVIHSETPPELFATFDLLHNEFEISQCRGNHRHRVEDVPASIYEIERYVFMGTFWKYTGRHTTDRVYIDYEGGVDEEIRGVFWEGLGDSTEVSVEYEFGGDCVTLVDKIPAAVISQIELRGKILPTMGGSRYTPESERRGCGGILLSRTVDSSDCEPGLTPRNGSLALRFSEENTCSVFLLVSRDVILG